MITNRTPRTEETSKHLVWVVFEGSCPECGKYPYEDIPMLCEWYVGWSYEEESHVKCMRDGLRLWLLSLPFGVITKIPNSDNTVVVVRKGEE